MTELCDLAYKYGSDKCPQNKHHFTEWYYQEFVNRKNDVRKVVEIGIGELGIPNPMNCTIGASLYMWRDFFPNAMIYGVDIDPKLLIQDDRIRSFEYNQWKEQDMFQLLNQVGTDIDLFVDDGSHISVHQYITCLTVMSRLKRGAVYVIEDLYDNSSVEPLKQHFNCTVWRRSQTKYRDDRLLIVRHYG